MQTKTLNERMDIVEEAVRSLVEQVNVLKGSVVLVARKKPGPKRINRRLVEADVKRKLKAKQVKPGFRIRPFKEENAVTGAE